MKYSEFKTEVEKMGLDVDANERIVFARTKSGSIMMAIYKSMENYVDCGWSPYIDTMTDAQRGELFDLAYQLAKTPLVEREEENLYNVIFPTIQRDGNFIYMARDNSNGDPLGIDWSDYIYMKRNPTKFAFTEQEIKDIDERYFLFAEEVKK